MMKSSLSNRYNLPDEIVRAIQADPYDKGYADISVTQLIGPPRLWVLRERYGNQIEEDVTDRLFALYGSMVHALLERAGGDEVVCEERRTIDVLGWKVSGAVDIYQPDGHLIRDYKFVGVGSTYDGVKPGWEQQLNCYAHIWRATGSPVFQLQIACLYRDWILTKAKNDSAYPPPVQVFDVNVWKPEDADEFIYNRVTIFQAAQASPDSELPKCTAEERWCRGGFWRLRKEGRKTALRRLNTFEEAREALDAQVAKDPRGKYYIEEAKPDSIRCKFYCPVLPFCKQGLAEVGQ